MRLTLSLGLGFAMAGIGMARIDYRIQVREGANHLDVEMVIPSDGSAVVVQVPNWAPGSYRLVDSFKSIEGVEGLRANQKAAITRLDDNSWEVAAGAKGNVVVRYKRVLGSPLSDRYHMTGPANYLYVKGRIEEDCKVRFDLPESWRATCGLEEEGAAFAAPSYDVLADNPVTIGVFESDFYELGGVKHEIAYYGGDVGLVDRGAVIEYCKKITLLQEDFWGGLPFEKYVWHFTVMNTRDGGWGLEHLSSTTIGLAAGVGKGTVSVMNHEYFHAWNVKRIRSKVLGPFNYLELPKTGALWMLEGVTDYYANLLLYRYGVFDEEYMKSEIIGNVRTTRANPLRMEISPYDSSYRVGEASNGRGNSAGFGVNYYNTGWVVGLCLDLELREITGGNYSLDDLMYRLWEQCKDDQSGFEEHDMRKHLVEMGGEAMGAAYDKWVMKPGELPVEAQLAKIGYDFKTKENMFDDLGFGYIFGVDNRLVVTRGSRDRNYLTNDEIVEINGVKKGVDTASVEKVWEQWRGMIKPGANLKLVLERGSERLEREVDVKVGKSTTFEIVELSDASAAMQSLRDGWFRGPRGGGKPVVIP